MLQHTYFSGITALSSVQQVKHMDLMVHVMHIVS
jgi:hypothetical protein